MKATEPKKRLRLFISMIKLSSKGGAILMDITAWNPGFIIPGSIAGCRTANGGKINNSQAECLARLCLAPV